MTCRRCGKCCSLGIRVAEKDIEREPRIAEYVEGGMLSQLGEICPFLGPDNLCTIYETRPDVCRRFVYGGEVCRKLNDMGCGKPTKANILKSGARRRETIAGIFAEGKPEVALRHRLAQCVRASDCGRLCRCLVKDAGLSRVYCMDHGKEPSELISLYGALEDPEFRCPEGLF